MKTFIDTSSLWKRFVEEPGSEALAQKLEETSEVVVSAVTLLEMHSVLSRSVFLKKMTKNEAQKILSEIKKDFDYFSFVEMNDNVTQCACRLFAKHQMKTLDMIQLASAVIADVRVFMTSDKKLGQAAKKEIKEVFIV